LHGHHYHNSHQHYNNDSNNNNNNNNPNTHSSGSSSSGSTCSNNNNNTSNTNKPPRLEFNVRLPENNEVDERATDSKPVDPEREIGMKIIKRLGDGMSGTVFEVQDIRTGEHYAMKRLHRRDKFAEWLFVTECSFLKRVRCRGVIQMINCFADDEYYYILTELGTIDLFKRLKNAKSMPEDVTRGIIFRLLKTLALLHKHNVVHRDVKPENIVFTKKGTLKQPKMIDFGDVKVVKDDEIYNELVGTRCYLSPERWRHHYGHELKASDVWAVGVLAFEMVTGKRCFYAPTDEKLTEKIQTGKWQFPKDANISPLFADFVQRMLTINVNRRPSAEYAMKHPFFTCAMKSTNTIDRGVYADKSVTHEHALRIWCNELSLHRSTYSPSKTKAVDHA